MKLGYANCWLHDAHVKTWLCFKRGQWRAGNGNKFDTKKRADGKWAQKQYAKGKFGPLERLS